MKTQTKNLIKKIDELKKDMKLNKSNKETNKKENKNELISDVIIFQEILNRIEDYKKTKSLNDYINISSDIKEFQKLYNLNTDKIYFLKRYLDFVKECIEGKFLFYINNK